MKVSADRPRLREQMTGMAFAAPFIVGFSVFLAYPLVQAVHFSFTQYPMLQSPMWIGLDNFRALMVDPDFWKSLRNTLLFALMSVPFTMGISVMLALLLNCPIKAPGVWRTIVFLPSLVPSVASAMLWLWLLNGKDGLLNVLLRNVAGVFGLQFTPPDWLGSQTIVLPVLAFIGFWGVGNTVVIFLAGLQDIPREMYEAAEIDGAGAWQRLRHVTLPMLSPVMFFNLIMGIIGSWSIFDVPYILTGGGGTNHAAYFYTMYIRDAAFIYTEAGKASALAMIQFLIVTVLTVLVVWSSRRWVHYR